MPVGNMKCAYAGDADFKEPGNNFTYIQNHITSMFKNDGGRAGWAYKYIPRGNVEVDAWVASTTYTSGMVDYISVNNVSMTGEAVWFYADILFGAQWFTGSSEGDLIYDGSLSWKNYDLGRCSGSFKMWY